MWKREEETSGINKSFRGHEGTILKDWRLSTILPGAGGKDIVRTDAE